MKRNVYYNGQLKNISRDLNCSLDFKIDKIGNLYFYSNFNNSVFGGIFLGYNGDYWTINLFRLLFKSRKNDNQVIKLDSKKAFLFVCGRDILDLSLESGMYFVTDSFNNFLGVAVKDGDIFRNLLDIGIFLYERNFASKLMGVDFEDKSVKKKVNFQKNRFKNTKFKKDRSR